MPLFSIVANHRKRAYLFNLNSTETIDSSNLSNESRYINHDQEFDNCHAIGRRHIFSLQIQLDHLSQSAAPFLFFLLIISFSFSCQRRASDWDVCRSVIPRVLRIVRGREPSSSSAEQIPLGAEILLDYGDEFFNADMPEVPRARKNADQKLAMGHRHATKQGQAIADLRAAEKKKRRNGKEKVQAATWAGYEGEGKGKGKQKGQQGSEHSANTRRTGRSPAGGAVLHSAISDLRDTMADVALHPREGKQDVKNSTDKRKDVKGEKKRKSRIRKLPTATPVKEEGDSKLGMAIKLEELAESKLSDEIPTSNIPPLVTDPVKNTTDSKPVQIEAAVVTAAYESKGEALDSPNKSLPKYVYSLDQHSSDETYDEDTPSLSLSRSQTPSQKAKKRKSRRPVRKRLKTEGNPGGFVPAQKYDEVEVDGASVVAVVIANANATGV